MNRIQKVSARALLLIALALFGVADAKELTYRVEVRNTSNSALANVPVTFGHPFLRGDIPAGRTLKGVIVGSGTELGLQLDRVATHSDGSLRYAIISTTLPSLSANQLISIELLPHTSPLSGAAVTRQSLVESGQSMQVNLNLGGQTYRATLAEALESPVDQWLNGPVASEWISDVPLRRVSDGQAHSDLRARFYARKYAATNNVKVDLVVENLTTFVGTRASFDYAAEVRINGNVVYSKSDISHYYNTRWKYTFWTQGQPAIHIAFDPATLMATRAVPTYDPQLIHNLTNQPNYSGFLGSSYGDHGSGIMIDRYGPMGRGLVSRNMSSTGARSEIGPLPDWTANWILTQTPNAKLALIRSSDLAGSWGIHFRDENTGRPVTIDSAYGGYPRWGLGTGNPDPIPVSRSGNGTPLSEDDAHQPQFNFVPYLVTGDYFHLEELEFWAAYNLAKANPGSVVEPNTSGGDGYRNRDKGYITNRGQLRARAWNMRTLAMIAAFSPDDYYTKTYWERILENNLERYYWRWVTQNNYGYGDHRRPDGTQPWMDDYMTWALAYTLDQGYESARIASEWKALFPVARMGKGSLNSNWCWQAATAFKLGLQPADGSLWPTINDWWAAYMPEAQGKTCNTPEIAGALGVSGPGDMTGRPDSSSSYVAQMSMALAAAVDLEIEGAKEAWDIYSGATGERSEFPDFRGSPRFAIVPRTYQPETASRPRPPTVWVE